MGKISGYTESKVFLFDENRRHVVNEMMRLLREVMSDFIEDMSVCNDYYEMMMYVWRRMNEQDTGWDEVKAASLLLCILYRDGVIHQNQISAEGCLAMKWAEEYLEDTNVVTYMGQYKSLNVV